MPARIDAATLEARAVRLSSRAFAGAAKLRALDLLVASLDLTTLEGTDTPAHVRSLCARAAHARVAAVCVYAAAVPVARQALAGSGVRVAAVSTAFPSGLAPAASRARETRETVAMGAVEIDMVIDRSALLAGRYREVYDDVVRVREACGGARLKVILEAGELGSYVALRRACDLALDAGADFLKNATGKGVVPATPPIAVAMCEAIRDHARRTGRGAGIKLAGGIGSVRSAFAYFAIVHGVLGDAWLVPDRFRIGASSLLDALTRARGASA